MYRLVIRNYKDPDYRHVVAERETERALGRVVVNLDLDHANYYTVIEPPEEE
jgi:hypothetical protein